MLFTQQLYFVIFLLRQEEGSKRGAECGGGKEKRGLMWGRGGKEGPNVGEVGKEGPNGGEGRKIGA